MMIARGLLRSSAASKHVPRKLPSGIVADLASGSGGGLPARGGTVRPEATGPAIFSSLKPRCPKDTLNPKGKQQSNETNRVGAEARQDTLQDILYSSQSFEADAIGAPSPRRHSLKVRPLNLDCPYENSFPNVQDSFSIDRISLRSQNSISRRVSFRLPDESDVFIIPARKDSDDYSTDDESTESVSEECIDAKRTRCAITRK